MRVLERSTANENPASVEHQSVTELVIITYCPARTVDASNQSCKEDTVEQLPLTAIPESDVDCRDDADTRTSPTERPGSAIAASPAEMDEPDSTKTTVDVDELANSPIPTPDEADSVEDNIETLINANVAPGEVNPSPEPKSAVIVEETIET
jgi:hypothetical protein